MFKLEFDTDNAAFEDLSREVARILFEIRNKVMNQHRDGAVMDSNGNKIGRWELTA